MFRNHKIATAVGAVGAAIVLGHMTLGPSVVPVAGAAIGFLVVVAALLFIVILDRLERRRGARADQSRQ